MVTFARTRRVAALVLFAAAVPARAGAPVRVAIDLTGAPRHLVHATVTIPASPGAMTLYYPKWLPGEHGPTGPIKDMAGLRVQATGKDIGWARDPLDMYAFRVEIPAGATSLEADFDILSSASPDGFSSGASSTATLAVLSWNQVLLYPSGAKGDAIVYAATVKLPAGWDFATSLPVASSTGGTVAFAPVSLTTLVDSPVLAGAHLRKILLDGKPGDGSVELDMAADNPAALAIPPEVESAYRKLVKEADALFGARHFRDYHFLLTISDQVAHFGLEHHASSDDRVRERSFLDDDVRTTMLGLLPHEYAHSWNGKYRRPARLNPDEFHAPQDTSLLWVYEGLTQYLGWVLTARSSLRTIDANLDDLAIRAAELDVRAGRAWRPLQDTAVAGQLLYETPEAWRSWRRGTDFYDEGTLIWLEADLTIRRLTKGAKSLDDFCRAFHGGGTGLPEVKTYEFEDVTAALNAVAPYDWAKFLRDRLLRRDKGAPLGGIDAGGFKLAYGADRSPLLQSEEKVREFVEARNSLGLCAEKGGAIVDVVPGSPAWDAGVAPGMTVVAVDGLKFSEDRLRDAIRGTKDKTAPVRLLVENGETFFELSIPLSGGARYPRLERDPAKPDILRDILAPRSR